MYEHIGNSNKIINDSLHDNKYEVIQAKVTDLKKKRKLESEQLVFPLSKHRFGYKSSAFEHEQPLALKSDENKEIHAHTYKGKRVLELTDENAELGSVEDSNSVIGGYDSTVSGNREDEKKMLEDEDYAQSVTSSDSCSSNNSLKDTLHSLHRRIVKEHTIGKEAFVAGIGQPNHPNNKDQLHIGQGVQVLEDQHQQFEEDADCIGLPYQIDGLEKCLDKEFEDIFLYSNGPSETDTTVLSSERWSMDKEARKPTIDQEFEQYFSSLMLS